MEQEGTYWCSRFGWSNPNFDLSRWLQLSWLLVWMASCMFCHYKTQSYPYVFSTLKVVMCLIWNLSAVVCLLLSSWELLMVNPILVTWICLLYAWLLENFFIYSVLGHCFLWPRWKSFRSRRRKCYRRACLLLQKPPPTSHWSQDHWWPMVSFSKLLRH